MVRGFFKLIALRLFELDGWLCGPGDRTIFFCTTRLGIPPSAQITSDGPWPRQTSRRGQQATLNRNGFDRCTMHGGGTSSM
ncbi:hypothetical protein PGT21_006444 [Puccinia graminis f. sp. tritici]|uniref:Secreted protein n=1 Tax=Puccinia graminis f. sp. tritici TaxID=56615 RepID=A0A5B0S0Q3_PUCGR|nr:hypothetical protein PGT21_006444 [Puccinia graminis f. sp. tritici]KAA1130633.1 hypothetical protein PGTUg99_014318 [Puccinia graminis f. sp. tritici]